MKKFISVVLLLAMCIACFAGCAPEAKEDAALEAAKEYLYTMYKDSDVKTTVDYTVVSQVRIDDVTYPITWTTDVAEDLVKITAGENSMTIVDINETPSEEVNYKLTATLKNEDGLEVSVSFDHMIPKALGMKEIVEQAYQLESGKAMEGTYTLTGVISNVDTPWSADYKNITVTIKVEGIEDKPMMCYRLKGDGAENLKYGDTITVRGSIKNYNGTIEFDAGCELLSVEAGTAVEAPGYDPTGKTADEIIDAAYALESGKSMSAEATLTGVISSVDTAWDDSYQNITVTIKVAGKEDKPIMCFRMKGDGAKDLKVGDTITCTGTIKNYNGTIEFDAGCKVSNIVAGAGTTTPPATDPPATNPPATQAPAVSTGASVTFDFSGVKLDSSTTSLDKAESTVTPLEVFNNATSNSGLVSATAKNVYLGNSSDSGALPSQGGFLKAGKSQEDGQITLTFGKKVAKVEILCHDWYAKSEKYPTNSNTISVNGGDAQLTAYTENGTPSILTFNLDGSSDTVTIDTANTKSGGGRAFIFKIIVTFVG